MNLRSTSHIFGFGTIIFLCTSIAWCDRHLDISTKNDRSVSKAGTSDLKDQPLADQQTRLIQMAFETATAIPVSPHLKDRSSAQEKVVATCLALDQPRRAECYIKQIENWRQGSCYADLAYYCATHDDPVNANRFLDLAGRNAEHADGWRRGRIRIKMARVHVLLGQQNQAEQIENDVDESEQGKIAKTKAAFCDEDDFPGQIKALDALIATANYDIMMNAMESYVELFRRFYEDSERRTIIENKLRKSWGTMPVLSRIKIQKKLVECALEKGDSKTARLWIHSAWKLADNTQWPLRFEIPLKARLAALQYRAGETAIARKRTDESLGLFRENQNDIVNIDRAQAVRPIAEAYQTMGDTSKAMEVYTLAVDQGAVNPNSRPRAEDLSATCCSMAYHNLAPTKKLWQRLEEIRKGLGHPW